MLCVLIEGHIGKPLRLPFGKESKSLISIYSIVSKLLSKQFLFYKKKIKLIDFKLRRLSLDYCFLSLREIERRVLKNEFY